MGAGAKVATGVLALLAAASAAAQVYPARTGEAGILDVPDAEVSGPGSGRLAAELRFDRARGVSDDVGPFPIYATAGVSRRLDLGFTMREWGQPGDERPARMLFGAAAKLQLVPPEGHAFGLAVSAVADRFNANGVLGARLATSTTVLAIRFAAFGGYEAAADGFRDGGATAGVAVVAPITRRVSIAGEALTGPRGDNFGGALRVLSGPTTAISLGANYFPSSEGFRFGLTFTFIPPAKPRVTADPKKPGEAPPEPEVVAVDAQLEERPLLRLRMPMADPAALADERTSQHAPLSSRTARVAVAAAPAVEVGRAAVPSLESLADAQLREQETLADGRERRVRATGDQLDAREKELLERSRALDQRERDLGATERQLAEREARTAKITPTPEQRVLESMEVQLAGQERALSVVEKSFGPAFDSASRRERDATDREATERGEAARLAASAQAQPSRAQQLEVRKQALAARNRQLAAVEARLVSKSEKVDVIQRQLGARTERIDCWSRRLAAHGEWLDAFDKRLEAPKPKPAPEPKPAEPKAEAPKDKAVFVMTTKAPPPPPAAGAAPAATGEKAVAAATVVSFPSAASALSDLDREAIDNIARVAARENCAVLVWARAKEPALQAEAERRVAELKARLVSSGPLTPDQVKTRVTMRPGAQGVDVVVSALRDFSAPPQGGKAP